MRLPAAENGFDVGQETMVCLPRAPRCGLAWPRNPPLRTRSRLRAGSAGPARRCRCAHGVRVSPGVDQRRQGHVAADAAETVEMEDAHPEIKQAHGRRPGGSDYPRAAARGHLHTRTPFSPVHGAFRAAVLGPPLTAGDGTRPTVFEPRSRGFSLSGFSHFHRGLVKAGQREAP